MFHTVDTYNATIIPGDKPTYALLSASVPCFVQPASSKNAFSYYQRNIEVSHMVYFCANPSVGVEDYLLYGSRKLWVIGVRNAVELDRVWEIACNEDLGHQRRP